jgi:GT2 family glycosyltransferase
VDIDLTYCVVNNDGRDYLLDCLAAIDANHPAGLSREVLVLDNHSSDGSVEAVQQRFPEAKVIALEAKAGKAANDSTLLQQADGRYCLLLNEDSEIREGTVAALVAALDSDPQAGAAGAQLFDGEGHPYACAWRFPGVKTAIVGALFLHSRLTVQSKDDETREVDWVQSSAMLVRREAAEQVGWLDEQFFVYYDECDFCKRLGTAGWRTLYVPKARAIHHDQLSTDLGSGLPRIVEFHRNRDLYMRKHHSAIEALAVRVLTAWSYGVRALVAKMRRSDLAPVMWAHARQALLPARGQGIRDRVEARQSR